MTDFRDFQQPLYTIYRLLSKSASSRYQQISISGGYHLYISIQNNRISHTRLDHDLSVHLLCAEKPGKSFRVGKDVRCDMSCLASWQKTVDMLMAMAINGEDPRPAFSELPSVDDPPQSLPQYDPLVAECSPVIAFHHIFQTLQDVLKNKYIINADISFHSGNHTWSMKPMNFGWINPHGFCYCPQTCIDEHYTLHHQENSKIRRIVHHTVCHLKDTVDLHDAVNTIESLKFLPFFSFSARNIDSILFSAEVSARLTREFIRLYENNTSVLVDINSPILSTDLKIDCDVTDPLFSLNGLISSDGELVNVVPVIQDGVLVNIPKGNGHIDGQSGHTRILRPILKPVQTDNDFQHIHDGKILYIDEISIQHVSTFTPYIYFPYGGSLYIDGKLAGRVAPPQTSFAIWDILKHVHPASNPIRVGNMASCSLTIPFHELVTQR